MQFTKDDAAKWAKRCKTRTKLFRVNRKLYDFMKSVGWLDEFYPPYTRSHRLIYLINVNGYPNTYKIGTTDADNFEAHKMWLFKSMHATPIVIVARVVKSPVALQKLLLGAYGRKIDNEHYLRDYRHRDAVRILTKDEADSITRIINEVPSA